MITVLDELELRNTPTNHVLYFYATWMPKSIGGHMYKMASKAEEIGVPVFAIDVDAFKSQVKIHDIQRVPTLLFFANGNLVKKIEGYMLTASYRATLREIYKQNNEEESNEERY